MFHSIQMFRRRRRLRRRMGHALFLEPLESRLLLAALDPNLFSSLGSLPGGSFTLNTTALTVGGQAGGVEVDGVAVFAFDGGSTLASGETISVVGSLPAALLFQGSASINGTILANGGRGGDGGGINSGGLRGPGGFTGTDSNFD